ncbi:MAG: hypothetical protein GY941_03095 [Planctomycetes bacterium]|nr:hypothetical protein [Planctomycetota bacterium]
MPIGVRESLKRLSKDPEQFIIDKYYRSHTPDGFHIELFVARKYVETTCKFKALRHKYRNGNKSWLIKKRTLASPRFSALWQSLKNLSPIRSPKPVFCPYCEKRVVPRRLHKLDMGDIVIFFFTAGFWGLLLFIMSLFVRRCPTCNYSLRGFKPLPKQN